MKQPAKQPATITHRPAASIGRENLVLSLFPGIGLLDRAFEAEGWCVVRGPDVLWGGDVRDFFPPAGVFAGVIGGPPCQTFSPLANLVRANGCEVRFGNLIPEYERVVSLARPAWFLMENVPKAPTPACDGYAIREFFLDNAFVAGPDGQGQEQMRLRKFVFGVRGPASANLLNWIDIATLLLPRGMEHVAVTGGHDKPPSIRNGRCRKAYLRRTVTSNVGGVTLKTAVTSKQGSNAPGKTAHGPGPRRYRLTEACRLQGLPEDFLADSPFTADGKLKAVANGVPLPMGRALAKAVREALVSLSADTDAGRVSNVHI